MLIPNKFTKENNLKTFLPQYLLEYLTPKTEEIRFRRNAPVIFIEENHELMTPYIFGASEMDILVDRLTEGSPAAYFDSIRDGYITIRGGHRVGISGTAVYEENKLTYIKDISSVNLRIAKEITGVADRLFEAVGHIRPLPGILIISPPGHGKTTLLRDFIRQISTGCSGLRIAVVDERSELAATYQGDAQNDLGSRCDILNGYKKTDGILSAIRSLSPDVIAVDEIGTPQDEDGLCYAHHAGISVIATIHGDHTGGFRKNIRKLTEEQVFSYEVYLSKGTYFDRMNTIRHTNGDAYA